MHLWIHRTALDLSDQSSLTCLWGHWQQCLLVRPWTGRTAHRLWLGGTGVEYRATSVSPRGAYGSVFQWVPVLAELITKMWLRAARAQLQYYFKIYGQPKFRGLASKASWTAAKKDHFRVHSQDWGLRSVGLVLEAQSGVTPSGSSGVWKLDKAKLGRGYATGESTGVWSYFWVWSQDHGWQVSHPVWAYLLKMAILALGIH